MIIRLLRALRRRMLESNITDMQDCLAGLEKQRANDKLAAEYTRGELILAQRRLLALIQEEINEGTAKNVRRMRR